jgi:hypothetical protein
VTHGFLDDEDCFGLRVLHFIYDYEVGGYVSDCK